MSTESQPTSASYSSMFSDPTGDIVLVSSDNVKFRLHKVVLGLASPIFRSMFSLPQSGGDVEEQEVQMSESGAALERMLSFWYPGTETTIDSDNLTGLSEVLELGLLKYDMQFLASMGKLQLQSYVVSDPLATFAVAARFGWKDLQLQAAKECLRLPLRTSVYKVPEEWRHVPGTTFHALIQYHHCCGEVVRKVANLPAPSWKCTNRSFSCYNCLNSSKESFSRPWFRGILSDLADKYALAPLADRSDDSAILSAGFAKASLCTNAACNQELYLAAVSLIANIWWPQIDAGIAKVELEL
ncbi:hypothetical protein C8F01DRAFT_1057883 [Mycena amicta]|nr:hypothetical protein C8F01DRAFT_1057883 [Mycena amicta]